MQVTLEALHPKLHWIWPLTWRICAHCGTGFRWQRGYRVLVDSFIAVDVINTYHYYCRTCIDSYDCVTKAGALIRSKRHDAKILRDH